MLKKEAGAAESASPGPASRWLSQDFSVLSERCHEQPGEVYDLVIVGSGYGGAMAAAQFAGGKNERGDPLKVCVLERGREYLPGMFPSRLSELGGHVRFSTRERPAPRGPREGLFDFRMGPDASALVANGLGGGSLINASVMEIPKFAEFSSHMPPAVVGDLQALYDETKNMLGAAAQSGSDYADNTIALHPEVVQKPLKKRTALDGLAAATGASSRHAALTVEMRGGVNEQGIYLNQCTLCGDCMTGCNVGARKSLDTNLLVRAQRAGADIYTCVSVMQIERKDQLWQLELVHTDKALQEKRGAPDLLLTRKLILAAGTFGSTEILLRSRGEGRLQFSPRLGERFSCNGDNLAAVHDMANEVRSHARETEPLVPGPHGGRHVGPTITGIVDMRPDPNAPGFLLQEFAVPAPLARLFGELVTTGDALNALPEADWDHHRPGSGKRDPLAVNPRAMRKTMLVGFIGHDGAQGRLSLPAGYAPAARPNAVATGAFEGGLRLDWERASEDAAINRAFSKFDEAATRLGRVVPNPLWRLLPPDLQGLAGNMQGGLLTVHPLGGCPMGADWRHGVVDDHGQVFDCLANKSDLWEGSLLVLDGSIIPASLGANPALTIAALSLRAARHWGPRWGWTHAQAAAPQVPKARPVHRKPEDCTQRHMEPTRLQLIERLNGEIGTLQGSGDKRYQLELTMAYAPKRVDWLSARMGRRLRLDQTSDEARQLNRLRVYCADIWKSERLDRKSEAERVPYVVAEAELDGNLYLLDREASSGFERVMRAGGAYLANRGWRDIWQLVFPDRARSEADSDSFPTRVRKGIKLASRAGEVRRFDYDLRITRVVHQRADLSLLRAGDEVKGHKRLTYERRSNPWNQLLYLELTDFPGLRAAAQRAGHPRLKLDAGFLAQRGVPLARVTKQENQPTALAELASFGLYFVRLMLYVHLWSFRAPDAGPPRKPQRLPGVVPGLPAPNIHEIDLVKAGSPVRVRLTRYANSARGNDQPPLVLIHGYSASGTTFAHPALDVSMAKYFWDLGRDIWILDLRTSAGMPTAKQHWRFEEVASSDIPWAIDYIVRQVAGERAVSQKQVQVDVFAHCVGAVMLSMALLTYHRAWRVRREDRDVLRKLPERINKVVLSQKGMSLSYTDANVLRAYVLRFLRPLLLPDGYSFRPPGHPSAADKLLDRFLAALPYPFAEFDRENPRQPWKRTAWSATRHRMDALYERTFSINNMPDKVLDHIDDFFGPLNVETVSQTIHFARHQSITDHLGRNLFVNARALKRWPCGGTLSLHGDDNGMVDPHTLTLMRETMALAGVPFEAKSLGPGVGHQDSLIGSRAVKTFDEVRSFLERPAPSPQKPVGGPRLDVPWLGPRLHITPTEGLELGPGGDLREHERGEIRLLIAADPGRGEALAAIVPVKRRAGGFDACGPRSYPTYWVRPYAGWLAMPLRLSEDDYDGFLVLTEASFPGDSNWTPKSHKAMRDQGPPLLRTKVQAVLDEDSERLAPAFVASAAIRKLRPRAACPDAVSLVLASCQYPAGILDAAPAKASLECLNERPELEAAPPCAVLMMGDQIYADATAGLFDPARADDRYGRNYEDWLRLQPLRTLMRKVPVHMMLDDHELADNWEPGLSWTEAEKRSSIRGYWRYQRGAVPMNSMGYRWFKVDVGSFNIFVADTRTERKSRPDQAEIMDSTQAQALGDWLDEQKARDGEGPPRPKFLATACWLAPRRAGAPGAPEVPSRCDGWEGYLESISELLGKIASRQIQGIVILSGDAHLGCFAELTVRAKGSSAAVSIACVHAPAMYAPFPFANARPEDYLKRDTLYFDFGGEPYECVVTTHWAGPGDGFATLEARQQAGKTWELRAAIHQAGGTREQTWAWG